MTGRSAMGWSLSTTGGSPGIYGCNSGRSRRYSGSTFCISQQSHMNTGIEIIIQRAREKSALNYIRLIAHVLYRSPTSYYADRTTVSTPCAPHGTRTRTSSVADLSSIGRRGTDPASRWLRLLTSFNLILPYQTSKIGFIPLRRKTFFSLPVTLSHKDTYNSCVSTA